MANFDSKLFAEIIRNANAGFLIQTAEGKISPLTQGAKGTIIEPSKAIKEMLFGGVAASEADELTKGLIAALGGKLKSGPRGTGRRGRKPKAATA